MGIVVSALGSDQDRTTSLDVPGSGDEHAPIVRSGGIQFMTRVEEIQEPAGDRGSRKPAVARHTGAACSLERENVSRHVRTELLHIAGANPLEVRSIQRGEHEKGCN